MPVGGYGITERPAAGSVRLRGALGGGVSSAPLVAAGRLVAVVREQALVGGDQGSGFRRTDVRQQPDLPREELHVLACRCLPGSAGKLSSAAGDPADLTDG